MLHLLASVFDARLLLCVCHVLANYLCLVIPCSADGTYSNKTCLYFRQCFFQVHLLPVPVGNPLAKEDIVMVGG